MDEASGAKRKTKEGRPRTPVQAQSKSRKQSADIFRLELHAHVSLEHVCYYVGLIDNYLSPKTHHDCNYM